MLGDIGVDLGTATVLIYGERRILLKEPSVVAIDTRTNTVIGIGNSADGLVGRAPEYIKAVHPLADGVISKYGLAEIMLKYYLHKVTRFFLVKPRITMCVPSGITEVETKAVVEAAYSAGARKVFLIDEPVAAALGAGIDISHPLGKLVVDVGGGTTDVALMSLGEIVKKSSIKVAGNKFDEVIAQTIRDKYNVIIGPKTAEKIKMEIGTVYGFDDNRKTEIRGRSLTNDLPKSITVSWRDIFDPLCDLAKQMALCIRKMLEEAPPDLVGDLKSTGMTLTGGGALLHGLDMFMTENIGAEAKVAPFPVNCVVIGSGKAFSHPELITAGLDALPKYDEIQIKHDLK